MGRIGPPRERYKFGPRCGSVGSADEVGREGDSGFTPCIYRPICRGYAPIDSPTVTYREHDGTVEEIGTPQSDYLFLAEKLGPDEVAIGRNAVGGTGRDLDRLLKPTGLRRSDITFANVVRCRPIAYDSHEACGGRGCDLCDNGQIPAVNDDGDNITISASFDQIRECTSRYLDQVLEEFNGKYIICLGSAAAYYMFGHAMEIGKSRGVIYEPGLTKSCEKCDGEKTVPGKPKKCGECKGRGTLKCAACGGVSKHKKKCDAPFYPCATCAESGTVPGKPKKCPTCHGAGEVPEDPDKPNVCKKLKPHQLLMITYHPVMTHKRPGYDVVTARDFTRITQMEKELEYATKAQYDEYPPPNSYGIAAEILAKTSDIRPYVRGKGEDLSLTFDLETTGLDADNGRITHFAFTDRPGYGCVLHPDDERVQRLLSSYPTLVGQNVVLFDWWWLVRHGYEIPKTSTVVDTRYLGKLINPDTPNDLPYLTSELADPPLRGYWKAKDDYRRHIERVACIDVDATTRVVRGAWDRLEQTGQAHFARSYIIPISRVVFEARLAGMKVNKERMEEAQERIQASLTEKRQELPSWMIQVTKKRKRAEVNLDNPGMGDLASLMQTLMQPEEYVVEEEFQMTSEGQHARVQEYLYERLGLPIQKNRGTWAVTAGRSALETLRGLLGRNDKKVQHLDDEKQQEALEFIDLLQELRDMAKLSSGFLRYKYSHEDKVHPELNPVGTATLRPSCSEPNVLQVPDCKCDPPCHGTENHECPGEAKCWGTAERCKNARWVFIPDEPDWEIMSVDLSQAEVIGFLWYAEQWDVLDRILNQGQDAYETIGTKVFGRDITPKERKQTKQDTLANIYGEGERTQALRLGVHVEDIYARRKQYEGALPGVADFRNQFISMAMNKGYVESPWGVRRYVRVTSKFGRAANEACNAPVQNICPMVTGHAAITLHSQLPKPARLWPTWAYDELNFVYPKELRNEVYTAARDILGGPVAKMPAPAIKMGSGLRFRLDFAIGKDWGHMQKMEVSK